MSGSLKCSLFKNSYSVSSLVLFKFFHNIKSKILIYHTLQPIALPHHLVHVKYLLGKDPLPWSEKKFSNVSMFNKEKFLAHFGFRHIPGFKFPTRVLATFCVTVLTVYQVN